MKTMTHAGWAFTFIKRVSFSSSPRSFVFLMHFSGRRDVVGCTLSGGG